MTDNTKRVISWMLAIVFSLVIFGSSCFIITHADHDCIGDDCSVCMELSECHKTLNTLGTAFMCSANLAVMMFISFMIASCFTTTRSDHATLISLKVELLN
ncbi:MAG: hypothetical protein GXY08_14305 [Ruminococcus sp.]|nr:hypothetical protein [Ruminococcus sp.]